MKVSLNLVMMSGSCWLKSVWVKLILWKLLILGILQCLWIKVELSHMVKEFDKKLFQNIKSFMSISLMFKFWMKMSSL